MLRLAEILLEPRPATTWTQLRQLGIDEATGVLPRANVDWRAHAPEQPWEHGPLALYQQQIEDAGFRLTVLEDNPPMDRLRLGLPANAATPFLVVEHILLRALPEDSINALPLLEAASRADPWSSQLSFVIPETLRPLEKLIQRITREETPAHLVAYLVWLDAAAFTAFAAAYDDLMKALRRHRLADQLGADPDAPAAAGAP
jgi:hypothetical protein